MGVDAFDPVAPSAPLADISAYRARATGATTLRSVADHLATLPDSLITATGASVARKLADWFAGIPDGVSLCPKASPALTGTPIAPTAAVDTNTTQVATTEFVVGQAGGSTPLMDGTGTVGTSKRYARDDHRHPTDTSRAPLASPTFTGTPVLPTPAHDGSKASASTNWTMTNLDIRRHADGLVTFNATLQASAGATSPAATVAAGWRPVAGTVILPCILNTTGLPPAVGFDMTTSGGLGAFGFSVGVAYLVSGMWQS